MDEHLDNWLIVVPGELLRDLAKQERPETEPPATADEMRERRKVNRRIDFRD